MANQIYSQQCNKGEHLKSRKKEEKKKTQMYTNKDILLPLYHSKQTRF